MSTDFENAVIVFGQSLKACWGTPKAREQAKRRLVELIDAEYDGTNFGLAMKCIVAQAAGTDPAPEPGIVLDDPSVLDTVPTPCQVEGKKGIPLIGIISQPRHILAWNYSEGLDVRVVADCERLGDREWTVFVWSSGRIRFQGTVLGGRSMADRFVRFLRNGMTSRTKKCRKNHENHKRNREARADAVTGKLIKQGNE